MVSKVCIIYHILHEFQLTQLIKFLMVKKEIGVQISSIQKTKWRLNLITKSYYQERIS